jgi:hypothetical protein
MHHSLIKVQVHTTLRNNSIILRNNHIITCNRSTTQHNLSTMPRNIIRCLCIMRREEIERAIEVEDEKEEVSDEVEYQWCVTIVNNQDIVQGNVHFHQQLVCIFMHRTMIQKNVRHY